MKRLLAILVLLAVAGTADAAINLVVSSKSGANVQDQADRLASRLGREIGSPVNVVVLADDAQVEAWLNRYATAEIALLESDYVSAKRGQFIVLGSVGPSLTLVGRQGIAADLPQRITRVLENGVTNRQEARERVTPAEGQSPARPPAAARPAVGVSTGTSKSIEEDRYYVIYVYREKFGKEPDPERLEYWSRQLRSGGLSKQAFYEQVCRDGLALCRKSE